MFDDQISLKISSYKDLISKLDDVIYDIKCISNTFKDDDRDLIMLSRQSVRSIENIQYETEEAIKYYEKVKVLNESK